MSGKIIITEGLYDLRHDEIQLTASSKRRNATWFHEQSHRLLSKESICGALEQDFDYTIRQGNLSPLCEIRLESLRDLLIRQSFNTHEGCSIYSGLVGGVVVDKVALTELLSVHTESYRRTVQPLIDLFPIDLGMRESDLVVNEYIVSCLGRVALNFPEVVDIKEDISTLSTFDDFIRKQNSDQRFDMLLARISSEGISKLKDAVFALTKDMFGLASSEVSFSSLPEPGHEYYSKRNEQIFGAIASMVPNLASRYLSVKERCSVLSRFYSRCSSITDEAGRQVFSIEHRENTKTSEKYWYVGNQRLTRANDLEEGFIHVDSDLFQATCKDSAGIENAFTIVKIELLNSASMRTGEKWTEYFLLHQRIVISRGRIEYSGKTRSGSYELDDRGPIWNVRFARPDYFVWIISLSDFKTLIDSPNYIDWPYPKFVFSDSDREFVNLVSNRCNDVDMFLLTGRSDVPNKIYFATVWVPKLNTWICLLTVGLNFNATIERLNKVEGVHRYDPAHGVNTYREFLIGSWWWTHSILGLKSVTVED